MAADATLDVQDEVNVLNVLNVLDVLVVGYGPVGAVLAAMLGRRGLSVGVVDPQKEPFPLPRAVGLDEETLRLLVGLPGLAGLLDRVHASGRSAILGPNRRVLIELGLGDSELGNPVAAFFHQPSFERDLRAGIATLPGVTVHLGRSVTALHQDGEPAAAGGSGGSGGSSGSGGSDGSGAPDGPVVAELDDGSRLRARWVVGCDGASSSVRAMLGVDYAGSTFTQPWLVVDVETPTPLAHLPYFSFVCDPRRPAVTMPMPGGHRWEWMLLPGEDPARMAQADGVRALLSDWVDPDSVRVVRTAVYTFHARAAARWRVGRILLAGDAAHSMPPFAGQGLGAGLRDAAALSWRLAEVVGGLAGEDLLDDYERERRPHVQAMTSAALRVGRVVQTTNPRLSRLTRSVLVTLDHAPGLRRALRGGAARPRPRLPRGVAGSRPAAGRILPNPRLRTLGGHIVRLDDLLTDAWTLIGHGIDPTADMDPAARDWVDRRAATALTVVAPGGLRAVSDVSCPAVEDLDGTLLHALRTRRPLPIALVRPDRYFAGLVAAPLLGSDLLDPAGHLRP
ncbi:bifunctional 3-(3-hydroxy-phenyl)propionate/3-hydroxycinnamic acid hydroxylase [Frankia sp. AvcI1]|uniref:bifunctional 3-(3-hydroxy-phenyl)propionate/3-hydroxycinnamic acid hydroxylase n=1 Tax=Frankia sp. AvcI1 TaxID=573496 RepID=UPI000A59CED1|nr:bifunctional 3-(3-hydroxy-phenyl)propionate/3-hydroxycinnamic acid hydroxylase [Frankia sp. AvcI1]